MRRIFEKNLKKIEAIHADFKQSPAKSLREELALGHGCRWDSNRNSILYNSEDFPKIIEDMKAGRTGDWKRYGKYDRAEIWKVWKVSESVPMIDALLPLVLDLRVSLTSRDMEDVSEVCQTRTSVLLGVKAFVIKMGFEGQFKGYHPQSSPVVEAEKFLFGDVLDRRDHKELCENWAMDFGSTPTGINTFLWHLGTNISK